MPPQPRQRTKLTHHPAKPEPADEPETDAADQGETGESSRAYAGTRGHADERPQGRADTGTGGRSDGRTHVPADAGTSGPESASTRTRSDTGTSGRANSGTEAHGDAGPQVQADTGEQWQNRKAARDAAYGWAAATRKAAKRANSWVSALERARAAGVPPGVLREQIEEAAYQAGASSAAVPDAAWRAAGIDPG